LTLSVDMTKTGVPSMSNGGFESEGWRGFSGELVSAYIEICIKHMAFYIKSRPESDLLCFTNVYTCNGGSLVTCFASEAVLNL
jgi:hypothetical protein